MKIFLRLALFLQVRAYFLAALSKRPKAEIYLQFFTNPGKVAQFVRWNKQKKRTRREMHFYGIELSKML